MEIADFYANINIIIIMFLLRESISLYNILLYYILFFIFYNLIIKISTILLYN